MNLSLFSFKRTIMFEILNGNWRVISALSAHSSSSPLLYSQRASPSSLLDWTGTASIKQFNRAQSYFTSACRKICLLHLSHHEAVGSRTSALRDQVSVSVNVSEMHVFRVWEEGSMGRTWRLDTGRSHWSMVGFTECWPLSHSGACLCSMQGRLNLMLSPGAERFCRPCPIPQIYRVSI